MDVIEKLFADLESNNVQRAEESKKRLSELFAQTKESWLVVGMMDYFGQTNSARIVDVLVKVQQPHDKHIFDRLCDWLHTVHRQQAITLFGHIVKRHPSWLYKVASHPFLRDILRLLKSDINIISAMHALFCIIILLPIIPTAMPQYLPDLFDIFLYLASWNCHHQPRLTEDQAIHLQIGLSAYFQRMYGMYPCNFVAYLRDHVQKEQPVVFQHTIRPLLETVKMHPMLLTSNRDLEKANGRWKEMEPHDVVVECSRFALDYQTRIGAGGAAALVAAGRSGELLAGDGVSASASSLISECPYYKIMSGRAVMETPISQQLRRLLKSTPSQASSLCSPFYSPFSETNDSATEPQRIDNIWSPLWSVLATPPPTTATSGGGSGAPPTPTPSMGGGAACYTIKPIGGGGGGGIAAATATNISHPQQQHQLQSISGSSPPEAAVEATPETTPMKELLHGTAHGRAFPVNSPAVRAIWGVPAQQPTSPLRRDIGTGSAFRFQPGSAGGGDVITNAMAISSPKILSFVNERHMYASQMIRDTVGGGMATALQPPASNNNAAGEGGGGAFATTRRQPLAADSTPEDAEVTQINSLVLRPPLPPQARFKRSPNGNTERMSTATPPQSDTAKANLSTELSSDADATVGSDADADETAADGDGNGDSDVHDDDGTNDNSPAEKVSARRLQSKRSHFAARKCERITIGTQTISQLPQSYDQMFLDLLAGTADSAPGPAIEACAPTVQQSATDAAAAADDATAVIAVTTVQRGPAQPAAPLSPYDLLDQYIQNVHRSPNAALSATSPTVSNANNDQIQLLQLQLQFERYRREVHAERNRRLLGKSRVNAALEMDNQELSEQRDRLAAESDELTAALNRARVQRTAQENEHDATVQRLQRDVLGERAAGAELRAGVEALQRSETDERRLRLAAVAELAACKAELFDMRNELAQTHERAEWGVRCREEMQRLQQEVLLMGEIQLKCRERLAEMNGWQTREAEAALVRSAYVEEVKEIRTSLDTKSAQLDTARARLTDLEAQLSRRDSMFTDQKRLLKIVKEEYQDRFRAVEAKYAAQKAVMLRLEEEMLDLYHRAQSATSNPTQGRGPGDASSGTVASGSGTSDGGGGLGESSADGAGCGDAAGGGTGSASAQQTPDADRHSVVGSLDHASPLSVSLASSEGLAISLRSTAKEIRNLHPLVAVASGSDATANSAGRTIDQQPAPSASIRNSGTTNSGSSQANDTANQPDGPPAAANRQPVSEDIPVPTSSASTSVVANNALHRGGPHHHQLHKHQHL